MVGTQLEELFVSGMDELIQKGINFEEIAHRTLRDILGNASSEVLFMVLGELDSPKVFVQKALRMFPGDTAGIILAMVASQAQSSLSAGGAAGDLQFEALMRKLSELPGIRPPERKSVLLHDHRAEDELDKLVGHKTD